ncbi:hypothetical protein DEO72_LG8g2062 [Vigna unguiculata]|uniref:Ulp1 protease family n=1 Tax=Vigna unguiculata TaxID=3917 RepID=A0A4D6MR79_VIGUN|nr:hypothetical protein DEO72_LG8g2062 [Vigna unguiculata]
MRATIAVFFFPIFGQPLARSAPKTTLLQLRFWFCNKRIVGKPRGQQLKVIYPKCNKQEDSWECGYYVMSWIRTIIRAAVKDEWIERFKNPSPLPDDIIHTLRQEWAAYLLERWS